MRYSNDKKREAVDLAARVGASAAGERLGISRMSIARWQRELDAVPERLTEQIVVRLAPSTLAQVESAAAEAGQSVSDYVRGLLQK